MHLKWPQYDYCIFRHLIIFKYLPFMLRLHAKTVPFVASVVASGMNVSIYMM